MTDPCNRGDSAPQGFQYFVFGFCPVQIDIIIQQKIFENLEPGPNKQISIDIFDKFVDYIFPANVQLVTIQE